MVTDMENLFVVCITVRVALANHDEATMVAVLVTLTPLVWDKSATSAGYASRLGRG